MQVERLELLHLISQRLSIRFGMIDCSKLKAYGVVGPILIILEYFSQERSLKVVLDGQSSPLITIARVPQRSVSGPTLFLVFINELPNEFLSRIWIYADGTTLFQSW